MYIYIWCLRCYSFFWRGETKTWTNHGQTMDKTWINHGQTMDKQHVYVWVLKPDLWKHKSRYSSCSTCFQIHIWISSKKNIVPIEPWTNRGQTVERMFFAVERMFFAVERMFFAVDRGTLKIHKNPLKTNSQTLGSFFGCFTVSPSCSPCHPKTQGCQSMW